MAFWRRKKEDEFVSLGLSRAAAEPASERPDPSQAAPETPPAGVENSRAALANICAGSGSFD
jgi:hypothetical protein